MWKTALNAGSSKHGNAERAFEASNWVVAKYLQFEIKDTFRDWLEQIKNHEA